MGGSHLPLPTIITLTLIASFVCLKCSEFRETLVAWWTQGNHHRGQKETPGWWQGNIFTIPEFHKPGLQIKLGIFSHWLSHEIISDWKKILFLVIGCFSYRTFCSRCKNLMQIFFWYKCKISYSIHWCMEIYFVETVFSDKTFISCSQELFSKKRDWKKLKELKELCLAISFLSRFPII